MKMKKITFVTLAAAFGSISAHAVDGSWNVDAAGNWSVSGNWLGSPDPVPGGAGSIISFTNNISAARTITVNTTNRTMGTLNIGDSDNTHAFTINSSGGGYIIFDNGGVGASLTESGSVADVINSQIDLADNLAVSVGGGLTLGGAITGVGNTLTKTGAGTLTISGNNTHTANISTSSGLSLSSGTTTFNGNVTLSGGTLAISGTTIVGSGKLTIAGGTTVNALASFQMSNAVDMSGTVNLGRGITGVKTWTQNSAGAVTLTGNTTLNSLNNGFTWVANSVIGETGGARSLTLSGNTMTATLNAANTYSGGTNNGSKTLNINNGGSGGTSSAIGTGTLTITGGTINNTSGNAVILSTNNTQSWNGNFSFTGSNALNLGTGAVTMNANRIVTVTANTLTVGGAIGQSGGARTLTKAGAGTLVLDGNSGYTGNTTVSAGTLIINGNISTSPLATVASGATIGGSGGTTGALTIQSGGFIAPGNSPGILNTGNYTQAGTYTAEIGGLTAGTEHDQINVTGTVNITGGSLTTLFSGSGYAINDMVFILLNDGADAIIGAYTGLAQGATVSSYGGFDWQISYIADSVGGTFTGGNDIALMAIPEPSTALLSGLGMLVLLRRRR